MNMSDNDGRATLTWNTPSELWSQLGDPLDSIAGTTSSWASPMHCRGRATDGYRQRRSRRLPTTGRSTVSSRLQRHAVHRDRQRHALNTPSNQQTADLVGDFKVLGNIGASGRWFDTAAFAQPTGVRFGNTSRNQFYGPGGWNLDFSLFRSFPVGGTRRLEYRLQAGNVLNHPVSATRHRASRPARSDRSPASRQLPGAQIQMGLRFSF